MNNSVRALHIIADRARIALQLENDRRLENNAGWKAVTQAQYDFDLALLHISLDDADYELTSAAMRFFQDCTTVAYDRLIDAALVCHATDQDEREVPVWLYA